MMYPDYPTQSKVKALVMNNALLLLMALLSSVLLAAAGLLQFS